ncbi:MAG: signal peptidase I [Sphingomonas sp.]|nr:signal peptidase I [Sphingomonas sp.]
MDETAPQTLTGAMPAPTPRSEWRQTISFLVKLAIIFTALRSFAFAPFMIPSASMVPGLYVGDYLIVSKFSYGWSRHSLPFSAPILSRRAFAALPARGDIAVFKAPPLAEQDYVKRVIGLPGDTIQMRGGQIILNGVAVPQQAAGDGVAPVTAGEGCPTTMQVSQDGIVQCRYRRYRETLPGGKSYIVMDRGATAADNTALFTVPAGHLFMMGDNRDNSADSRFPAVPGQGIGYVPVENLVGRAQFVFFSTDGSASWLLPWTWVSAARWERIGGAL